jgi:serine/threonine-protein kinase
VEDPRENGDPPRIAPCEASIRVQLAHILASPQFINAQRSRRFLEFTVEQTLSGAKDSVKESVIALEVFERKGDFDPRIDAIVRVEATKLRTRLNEYYGGEGARAPVIIEIPKGTYVPRFSLRPGTGDVESPSDPPPKIRRVETMVAFVALAAVLCGTALWLAFRFRFATNARPREIQAIAMMPFLNLSAEPDNAYFSDGLADQLTNALAQVGGLRVASRTSAFSFRGKPMDASEIGTKLRVNTILEGSVQRSSGRVRITLQLIQTRDGYHLWSQTFDRETKNIFDLQDEISRAVTDALKVSLDDASRRRRSRRYTRDPEAFDLYLRGLHLLNRPEPGNAPRAIAFFQQAIERDPQFALAHTGIAIGAAQGAYTELLPPREIAGRVRSAAQRALGIDDTLAEAHAILAMVEGKYDWNWVAAEQRFRRAIALDPRSSNVHFGYASGLLGPLGRWGEALAECRTALELDPLSVQMAYCAPWLHIFQDKAELALSEFQKLDADQPGAFMAGVIIAALAAGKEHQALALMELQKVDFAALLHFNPAQLAFLAYAYGRVGRTSEAVEIERLLNDASRTQYISPGGMSMVYLGLGRFDEAGKFASQQIQEHSFSIYTLAGPFHAPLRTDPQFSALLKTTGIAFTIPH